MFVRTKSSPNSPRKTVQIVESVRSGKRVSQHIVQYIGVAQDEDSLQQLLRLANQILEQLREERRANNPQMPLFPMEADASFEKKVDDCTSALINNLLNEDTVVDGPMLAAEQIFYQLGYDKIFGNSSRESGHRALLMQMLAGILARPSSKLSMSEWFAKNCATNISEDRMYRFMDALHKREDRVKEIVRQNSENLFREKPTMVLFDVTTIHNESEVQDNLRRKGFSKANKMNETQTVLALATDPDGMPLWYELFPGNTYEGETFLQFMKTWREDEYPDSKGVVVADSAVFSAVSLASLRGNNLRYAVGARIKNLPKALKEQILNPSLYTDLSAEDAKRYLVLPRKTDNLVVTYCPVRARKDAYKREEQLKKLKDQMDKSGEVSSASVKSKKGRSRFLKVSGGKDEPGYVLDEEKIAQEARWDGLHGIATDLPVSNQSEIRGVLSHYSSLWRIEESFRLVKSGLKIRPIFHRKEERIRAHIALVYMAYACIRHLQARLKLTQNVSMSVDVIREALLSVTSTLMREKKSRALYRFPRVLRPEASRIFRSLGIRHSTKPTQITSMAKYRTRRKYLQIENHEEAEAANA